MGVVLHTTTTPVSASISTQIRTAAVIGSAATSLSDCVLTSDILAPMFQYWRETIQVCQVPGIETDIVVRNEQNIAEIWADVNG